MERHGDRGPEVSNGRDPGPEPDAPRPHQLGPLEFDRDDLVYYASCGCGHRFGPVATVVSLQAAFERHRATVDRAGEAPDPPAG